ncbi:hypothetical protein CERZMDRAFT_80873 [Cercospora zeae-maydis SCOH1-5]|uniref:Hydrophobin n=1 Tax=Cercospora zeae-maydis SCOH1-5 TaxID=717836 RepID=A0A6A6FUF8_9PEZI|nr:hypothetical protein CERZMDRAFT_80873 [Cercospora zeae-maydis SCOH1-5]
MFFPTTLVFCALTAANIVFANKTPCFRCTTTAPHPAFSCTPFEGVCPAIICADAARPRATVTVAKNYEELVTKCANVPTVTSYSGKCTTDCGPITCPTLTVTKTAKTKERCCTEKKL